MLVWYDRTAPGDWQLYVNRDTVQVKERSREDYLAKHNLRLEEDATAGSKKLQQTAPAIQTIQLHPEKPALFGFNYPVAASDTSKWILSSDSLRVLNFTLQTDSTAPRQCRLEYAWTPGKSYNLELLPGAVTDFWGSNNADTIRRILSIPAEKQLGGLNLTVENIEAGKTYIIQLLDGARVAETRIFTAEDKLKKLTFTKLTVATYTARLIEDSNGNGIWDTGDYWKHRQPEPILSKKLDALRANWEVEALISLNTDGEIKKKKK